MTSPDRPPVEVAANLVNRASVPEAPTCQRENLEDELNRREIAASEFRDGSDDAGEWEPCHVCDVVLTIVFALAALAVLKIVEMLVGR